MATLFTNNAVSTLASSITNVQTTLALTAGGGVLFPNPTGGDFFYLTIIDSSNNLEIVKVTTRATDTLTIVRAQDGTAGIAFNAGSKVELRLTAAGLANKLDKDSGGTIAGPVTVNGTFSTTGNTVLGDAGADNVTINAATITIPNGVVVSGGTMNFAALQVGSVPAVGTTSSQTLTNKTIDTASNTVKVNGNTLTASAGTATLTMPNSTDTIVGRTTTDTLSNKTLSAPTITGGFIVDSITSGAGVAATSDVLAASSANKIVTPASLIAGQSQGASGYFTLPGGTRIMWGSAAGTLGTNSSVTFGTAFPSAIYQISIMVECASVSGYVIRESSISTTGFAYFWDWWATTGNGTACTIRYIAIGK